METETHLSGLTDYISALSIGLLFNLIITGLLVFVLAFISGAEVALSYIYQTFKSKPENLRTNTQNQIVKLTGNPYRLKIIFWISNLFFNVLLFIIFTILILEYFPGISTNYTLLFFTFLIITFIYVIIIEVLPKSYAGAKPEKFAKFAVYFIRFLIFIFGGIAKIIFKISSGNRQFQIDSLSLTSGDMSSKENLTDVFSEEEEILKGIVKFGNIDVGEILRPRVDVVAIDFSTNLHDVLKVVVDSGYSRIPVYSGNFDNIKGVLYVKDLLPYINEKNTFRWQTLIRPPYFVPESKKVKDLLTEFQANKIHMAIIVDEYGGTIGIVTLEDILEEIVGEISDESDEDEKFYTKINDNTYLFDAKTMLNDFHKILQSDAEIFDLVKGEADTLAGLILELKGAIPTKNEEIEYKQFVFKIEAVDSRRIKQIRVTIKETKEKD